MRPVCQSAQRLDFGDFKEQRGFAALDVEHLQQFFVRHLLEHHARTGGDVGLCAFLGGGVRGVDRQRFARAEQVLLRLVLRQTHLDVVLVLVLHAREDEHARVRRAVGVGGAHEVPNVAAGLAMLKEEAA